MCTLFLVGCPVDRDVRTFEGGVREVLLCVYSISCGLPGRQRCPYIRGRGREALLCVYSISCGLPGRQRCPYIRGRGKRGSIVCVLYFLWAAR